MESGEEFKVRDDVIGRRFPRESIRACPHPAVIKKYGTGGIAKVSIWTCKRCQYGLQSKFGDLVGCGYELGLSATKAD